MTSHAVTFEFFGDEYEVQWNGSVWVSPHNCQQHSTIGQAIRAELVYAIRAGGDDPGEFESEVAAAIAKAEGRD